MRVHALRAVPFVGGASRQPDPPPVPVDSLVLSADGAFLGGFHVDDLSGWGERIIERPKPPYPGSAEERFEAFLPDMHERSGDSTPRPGR